MARIYVEIELKSIHQNFEFLTDDNIVVHDFKEKMIKELQNKNQNLVLSSENTGVFSSKHQSQLNEEKSLKQNGVVSGDILLVI